MGTGGMADAIPISRALEEGWKKIVVIVTRNVSYRKKQRHLYLAMLRLIYHKYPKFVQMVKGRADKYNRSLELLAQLEQEGKAFIIRPSDELHLRNNEADPEKLREYYRHGYEVAKERMTELREFLKE